MIKLLFEYMAILSQENRITNTGYSFFKFNHLLRENYDLGSYDELGWWFSHSNAPKFFFRIIFRLRMPTRRTSKVSVQFSKSRNNDARIMPDFKDNSPQWWKKGVRKRNFEWHIKSLRTVCQTCQKASYVVSNETASKSEPTIPSWGRFIQKIEFRQTPLESVNRELNITRSWNFIQTVILAWFIGRMSFKLICIFYDFKAPLLENR